MNENLSSIYSAIDATKSINCRIYQRQIFIHNNLNFIKLLRDCLPYHHFLQSELSCFIAFFKSLLSKHFCKIKYLQS